MYHVWSFSNLPWQWCISCAVKVVNPWGLSLSYVTLKPAHYFCLKSSGGMARGFFVLITSYDTKTLHFDLGIENFYLLAICASHQTCFSMTWLKGVQ